MCCGRSRATSGALGAEWNEAFEFDLTAADVAASLVLYDKKVPTADGGYAQLCATELPIKEIMFRGACERW